MGVPGRMNQEWERSGFGYMAPPFRPQARPWISKTEDASVGFRSGSMVKNPPANAGDVGNMGSTPASGRFPGGGNGNPL